MASPIWKISKDRDSKSSLSTSSRPKISRNFPCHSSWLLTFVLSPCISERSLLSLQALSGYFYIAFRLREISSTTWTEPAPSFSLLSSPALSPNPCGRVTICHEVMFILPGSCSKKCRDRIGTQLSVLGKGQWRTQKYIKYPLKPWFICYI